MTGVAVDPPSASSDCSGCAKAEAEIRVLLGLISNSLLKDPSKFFGFDLPKSDPVDWPEIFDRWVKNFDGDSKYPLCPDLRKRIEALMHKLLRDTSPVPVPVPVPDSGSCRKRKAPPEPADDEGLTEMLTLLRGVAVDFGVGVDREWRRKVLNARKAMFLRRGDVSDEQALPYPKKDKPHKFLSATNGGLCNSRRKSQRTVLKIGNSELPRARVPIGPDFQTDVPNWTGPPTKEDLSDDNDELSSSRWLGIRVWPIQGQNRKLSEKMIGKTKAFACKCASRGSAECVRRHVEVARLRLKSDLGPSFFRLGFDEMGEEVSHSWTQEEQVKFDDLVRRTSDGKNFWEAALRHFTSKSRKDIVSFYFNVFLLRWMSIRTRQSNQPVYSSDDENV